MPGRGDVADGRPPALSKDLPTPEMGPVFVPATPLPHLNALALKHKPIPPGAT